MDYCVKPVIIILKCEQSEHKKFRLERKKIYNMLNYFAVCAQLTLLNASEASEKFSKIELKFDQKL